MNIVDDNLYKYEDNMNNVKHLDLREYYKSQPAPKAKYTTFLHRVNKYWYTKENAITDKNIKPLSTQSDTEWRVCTWCWIYKKWSDYHKNRTHKVRTKYTAKCRDCRNIQHRKYRQTNGRFIDKIYREKVRKLSVWEIITIPQDVEKDLLEHCMIQKREVVEYNYKKWYRIKSLLTGHYKRTTTNHNSTQSERKFIRVK